MNRAALERKERQQKLDTVDYIKRFLNIRLGTNSHDV